MWCDENTIWMHISNHYLTLKIKKQLYRSNENMSERVMLYRYYICWCARAYGSFKPLFWNRDKTVANSIKYALVLYFWVGYVHPKRRKTSNIRRTLPRERKLPPSRGHRNVSSISFHSTPTAIQQFRKRNTINHICKRQPRTHPKRKQSQELQQPISKCNTEPRIWCHRANLPHQQGKQNQTILLLGQRTPRRQWRRRRTPLLIMGTSTTMGIKYSRI